MPRQSGSAAAGAPSGDQLIAVTLWAATLVYANYLLSRLIGVYTWPVTLTLHAATVAGLALVYKTIRRHTPAEPPRDAAKRSSAAPPALLQALTQSRSFAWSWTAVAGVILTGVFLNLRTPPGGWDALTYHLDFPAQWIRAGEIFPAITAYGDYSPTYYPMLVEAFAGWYLLPGRGAVVADLVQTLFIPLLYFSLRDIAYFYARRLRLDDGSEIPGSAGARTPERRANQNSFSNPVSIAAEFAPLLILSLPYLQSSLLVADNDFVLCALLLAAWRGILKRGLVSFAAAAPIALSLTVKYTGLVYAGALVSTLLLMALAARLRSARQSARSAKRDSHGAHETQEPFAVGAAGLAGLALLAVIGASPYLLNLWLTGNPVYPAEVELFGWQFFAGYYPREFFTQHPFYEFRWLAFFTEPGLSLPLLIACCSAISAAIGLRANRISALLPPLLVPAALFLAFYLFVPLRQFRLALPVIACCGPAVILLEFAIARIRQRNPDGKFAGLSAIIETAAINIALPATIALQCLLVVLRFAESYSSPWPGGIHIGLNEISRATLTVVPFTTPGGALAFAALTLLVIALLVIARHIYRAASDRRLLRSFVAAAILTIAATAALHEQQRVAYSGDGLAAAYNTVRAMRESSRDSLHPGAIGVIGTNALFPLRHRRIGRRQNADERPGDERDGSITDVRLLLNRPHGDRALHLRDESLRYDPEAGGWLAIGTLAFREIFEANLRRYDIQTLLIATTIGTNGRWPAEYEWLQTDPKTWSCPHLFSNASSGDPGARVALCVRKPATNAKLKIAR